MGAKDSKPSFISYEDAVKRVPDSELRRIREAFKRCAGASGAALSLEAFVREVLSDGVPYAVGEWLFQACGGTKRGLAFRDLLCGLVVLTRGNIDEKIKFLWTLYVNYQNDNGLCLYKRDFSLALHFENTSLPVSAAHKTAEILTSLFGPSDKVSYEQFRSWVLIHKEATVLSKWLLAERFHAAQDLDTPTFYQSLAGVTHLEERDIIELEKCFWSLRSSAPTGQLDAATVCALLSPPLPRAAVAGAFLAFDDNRDGHIDFKELCCGVSAACRGPNTERLKFVFKMLDVDRDGVLRGQELADAVAVLATVANEAAHNNSRASTPSDGSTSDHGTEKFFDPEVILLNLRDKLITMPKEGRKPMFQLGPTGEVDHITIPDEEPPTPPPLEHDQEVPTGTSLVPPGAALPLEEFLIWAVESADALVAPFLELLFEVCHVVLGLRPQCKHQERDIVLGWLRRSVSRGYSVGQFWYLVGAEWWSLWLAHTGGGTCRRRRAPSTGQAHDHDHDNDDPLVADDSDATNSTESMGSLLWRGGGPGAAGAGAGGGGGAGGDTASLGSASSSGVSSHLASQPAARHPGPIDNKRLLQPNTLKVRTLTGEGGHLRRDVTLAQHRDFELVPDALWRALALWYGGPDPLPRQVIRPPNSDVELELYPLHLKLYRHVATTQRSVVSGVGGAGASLYSSGLSSAPAPPERQLAYTAAFSRLATVRQVSEFLSAALGIAREELRLWALGGTAVLLDDERHQLQQLALDERTPLLLEVRNPDLTWPEEIGALSMLGSGGGGSGRLGERRETLSAPNLPGATGLHNLGNTCYMNAALQSVWNTGPLTRYFNSGMHLFEVNLTNPLGTKGALALRYGDLCKEVWSCSARSVAPLRVRWCVSRHARHLAGGQQHDAQELLAWLLDALHEDLNRAHHHHHQPPPPAKDSDGRPDQVVAMEAWLSHVARNQSIVTDLFYGQLKSKVRCCACQGDSTRFDAFNMLSLPLPMECHLRAEVRVILLDGSVPVKYGARLPSDGTYRDLKDTLSELCGLPPQSMLVVELSGAVIGRVCEDSAKVAPSSACDLYAYEVPAPGEPGAPGAPMAPGEPVAPRGGDSDEDHATQAGDEGAPSAGGWPEVSAPRRPASSLCMPALFCFKRSRSEILMSASPPSMTQPVAVYRSSTLPRDLGDLKRSEPVPRSPTLSVRSLSLRSSPRPLRAASASAGAQGSHSSASSGSGLGRVHFLIAVHRKQCRSDAYFLPTQRSKPALFGVPLAVPVRDGMSGRDIYAGVWTQVARLLSIRPTIDQPNHATDCDDSLGYEFPFTLRLVSGAGGASAGCRCAACAWPALCRGCALPSDDAPLVYGCHGNGVVRTQRLSPPGQAPAGGGPDGTSPIARAKLQRQASGRSNDAGGEGDHPGELRRLDFNALRQTHRRPHSVWLAIDWDPTALHLRYQSTREKAWTEHSSVAACVALAGRPVDLGSCLRAFTSEERLEARYHCARCQAKQPATKKLQIWRAPPILIIHLKRFQYVNNKWIKSQKVVNFPFQDFDPTAYLASVPQETILRHVELSAGRAAGGSPRHIDGAISESDSEEETPPHQPPKDSKPKAKVERRKRDSAQGRQRLESTSLVTTPVTDDNLIDYHQHHLKKDQDPFDLKYRLYAVVSHSGQLSGGHYVCYARNPSGAWLCYNDSSCRELPAAPAPPIDPAAAYLLFYERQGLDYEAYLPDTAGREPVVRDTDTLDPDDSDLRKMCVIA